MTKGKSSADRVASPPDKSQVVGVTRFAAEYGRSRDWAERILEQWEEAQLAGTSGVRVFRAGKRGSLFTTVAVLHAFMPPGRDLALYRRVGTLESELADAHKRLDREIRAREALQRRVEALEARGRK